VLEGQPIEDEAEAVRESGLKLIESTQPIETNEQTEVAVELESVEAVPDSTEQGVPEEAGGLDVSNQVQETAETELEQQKAALPVDADGVVVQGMDVREQQNITNETQQDTQDIASPARNLEDQSPEGVSARNIKSGGEVAARERWALSELTTRATRDSTESGPTLPLSALASQEAVEATLESLRKEFDSKSQDFRDSVIDFYSGTSNEKTSNQAQSPPQSPLGEKTRLSPANAVKATDSSGVGVSNVDDGALSQWTEGKQPNGWVNVKSEFGEWTSSRNGVGWFIQAIPFNIGKSGKKVIKNVVFAPSGEISNAKSFSGDKTLSELQAAAESVENASRKRQGKPLLKQVSPESTGAVPTESPEGERTYDSSSIWCGYSSWLIICNPQPCRVYP